MPTTITATPGAFIALIQRSFGIILSLLLLLGGTQAQTSPTDGTTPLALSPGAPAGSYALSDLDNVNLYNGHLNFSLPLLTVGGRGRARMTLPLRIERIWRIEENAILLPGGGVKTIYIAQPNWWMGMEPYGLGKLAARHVGEGDQHCGGRNLYVISLTRLTFTAPDGAEYELRDQNSNGQPAHLGACPAEVSRGQVFVTADGTSATFISDTVIYDQIINPGPPGGPDITFPSGFLMTRDGTRYRIDNGQVSWLSDRNGNKVTITYGPQGQVSMITDSLNRKLTICYAFTAACGNPSYDLITFQGVAGVQRTIRVWYANLGDVLRTTQSGDIGTPQTMSQLFPEIQLGNGAQVFNPRVISAVELPNNQTYQFRYNAYGELARVVLPTGGAIEYDYAAGIVGSPASGVTGGGDIYRRVVARRMYLDGTTGSQAELMTYSRPESLLGEDLDYVIVDHYKPDGVTRLKQERHYFHGKVTDSFTLTPTQYSPWKHGRERQTEYLGADGSTVLRRVVNTWQQRPATTWFDPNSDEAPPNDPRIVETVTTLADANLVSKQTFSYDQYNNQTDVYEYDFGAGAPGPLIRRTHTDYLTSNNGVDYAASANIHIRNLPLRQQVFDAGGIKRAETFFEYDLYDNSSNHAPLIDRQGISGLDSNFTTGYTTRGNVTRVSRALLDNTGGVTGWIHTHAQYDIAGNVVKSIDANGNPTTLDFSDRFGSPGNDAQQNTPPAELNGQTSYAFATKVTNALGHTTYTKYDYYLGKPVASEDANGVVSSVAYDDALDRPTQSIQARYKVGVGVPDEKRQTTVTYDDTNRVITVSSDRDTFNDNDLTTKSYYDGLGRTWRNAAYEGSTWSIKDTQFDAMGRVSQVSNPYHATDPDSASPPSGLWTTTEYDALGRVIKVTTPDGAHVDTAYNGNQTTATDQAGKTRRSETDALGRLIKVIEDPGGLNYETTYLYDALDNLRKVTQGSQTRWFSYDSLSRLIRVKNPEQATNSSLPPHTDPITEGSGWSMAYFYDANGNLVSKTDARNITTNYTYDALNRNTSVDYSDTAASPDITRFYDNPDPGANGKGRFWYEYAGGDPVTGQRIERTTIDSYDALGRPLTKRQQFKSNGVWNGYYPISHAYDLAGNVKTVTYPSGHTVSYSYDQAGRLSSFSGNLGGSSYTYADTIGYNAAGQMIKERFGTNTSLYHNLHYNNRLQLISTRVGDSATDEWNKSRGAFDFFYGTEAVANGDIFANSTDNNGNLRRQVNWAPLEAGGYVIPQLNDYTYDALNRISSITEAQMNSSGQWTLNVASQSFGYDRFGNRWITSASGGVNNYNPSYDQTTNRIDGLGYDAAGNITSDPLTGGTMTYDAENRLLTATSGGGGSYVYDAAGKRTRRITGGQETWYIYGCGGELLAEYAAGAAPSAPQKEYGYRDGQLLVIAEPGSGGNLAWGKMASQSSTGFGGEASRGTDGNTSGNWYDNSVSHTNFEHQPWWQVDLGSVQQIGTVKLWNRTDCCGERLSNFYVLVSDNPFSSTDLTTTINQAGVSSYYTAGPVGASTEIGVWRSGRYVRVQLAGDDYLQLAEVEVMAATATEREVKWLVTDHLGSTRMVIDHTGSLGGVRRHDYLPFGEELSAGVGIRSAALGYGPDSTRQRFTGYERDSETGLDFAQARCYASVQGRFSSIDPIYFQAGMTTDPQRFNLYAYARNNPLKFSDPDGERVVLSGMTDWLRLFVLNEMAGGAEEFNRYFYVADNEVHIRDDVNYANLNAGAQLLYDLVSSADTYQYHAGTSGAEAADLFNAEGRDREALINRFEGTDQRSPDGILVGTQGRYGSAQPRNSFAVIAINPNTTTTQTGVTGSEGDYGVFFAQLEGLNQRVRPSSLFIHESAENFIFAGANPRPANTDRAGWSELYLRAHGAAKRREAIIREELRIPGGFAGGSLQAARTGGRR